MEAVEDQRKILLRKGEVSGEDPIFDKFRCIFCDFARGLASS